MVRTGHDALNIFMSNVQFITPQILHVDTGTMYEIGSLFIRMQEFYECPDERFRGKYFTLDEYTDWYAGRHPQGKFSYFEDWVGFNIPGSSLIKFWNVFTEKEGILRPKEAELFTHIKDFVFNDDPNFYVIGTFDADERTIAHETRHANYYLDREYRQTCDDIFKELPESVKDAVTLRLLEMGYSDTVIPDETQAYFGTESPASLKVLFNLSESPKGWADKFKNVRP